MKLVRFIRDDHVGWGAVREDQVIDLTRHVGDAHGAIHQHLANNCVNLSELARAATENIPLADVNYAPFLPDPSKILCVGVNYPERNQEYRDGSEAPAFPSLFMRTPLSFTGHDHPLVRPHESSQLDYEGEIAIVIGRRGRRIARERAHDHIAGITLVNDGTLRDWTRHGKFNVTQGKNFDASGSIGPWMVTLDEISSLDRLDLKTRVDGEIRQQGSTDQLIFGIADLLAYVSSFATLEVGDILSTGTPPGAGARLDPPRWLAPGNVVEVSSRNIGVLRNTVTDG